MGSGFLGLRMWRVEVRVGEGARSFREKLREMSETQRTFGLEKVGSGGFSYNGEGGEVGRGSSVIGLLKLV